MSRDASIPIFLWIATAALVHIVSGFEANEIAEIIESRTNVRRFAESVRRHVRAENATTEIALLDEAALERLVVDRAREGDPVADPEEPPVVEPDPERHDEQDRAQERAERPVEPTERVPEPPKPEKEKEKEEEKAVLQAEVLPFERSLRVAVEQVAPENQPDNPDAEFIADRANHTDQQTQARITSHEENAALPNPGTNNAPPADTPGNARLTEIGETDDAEGSERAAAESKESGQDDRNQATESGERGGQLAGGEPARASAGENENGQRQARAESKGQQASSAREQATEQQEFATAPSGLDEVPGASEASEYRPQRAAIRSQKRAPNSRKSPNLGGFGSLNTTPGGLNPNLDPASALAVIGADTLRRERRADGERRRSKHRGSWNTVGLEKWRSAIENYVASVQPGNQTSLNTAAVPFASYLNRIHQRLHPQFAEDFLSSLDALPRDHELNRNLRTYLEIVLSREDGRLVRMGVTRASGSTAFDVGALEAVQRAAPFGPPPGAIVSPDGNVYLHWEFHRDPIFACSTYHARPFLLRIAPTPAPPSEVPVPPAEPPEGGPLDGERRHGQRMLPSTKQDG